ncbi:MAG TPA: response regulator SirA [Anaerolineae bacterium]|nr:response regulator SirA [Anaerolineae bacterium]
MPKLTHVVKRSGAIVPFNIDRITNAIYRAAVSVGGRDRERAAWLAKQVVKFLEDTTPEGEHPHIERIQDAVEKVLIENQHAKVAKAYILYREERIQQRRKEAGSKQRPSENVPWSKTWQILDWAISQDVHTIEAMNARIRRDEFAEIVRVSEEAYEKEVDEAADFIMEHADEIRMVIISGPSSSGKTTTTIKLDQRLQREGMEFIPLNVDSYFFDLEMHPKDEFGDYDFETPQALDLELIREHLQRLIAGEEVLLPRYDFKTSKRALNQIPMRLAENQVLLIDSLHGLFPKMTEGIPDELKAKLYLEPLLQMKAADDRYIRWTDIRLIRRMLRDATHRSYSPRQTLEHWHYVRSSEMRNIIPYLSTADRIINSAMPYEIALYRPMLLDDFAQWAQDYRDDPLREDAFLRARRVHAFLSEVDPVETDADVPSDSVLREFIGGSNLVY